MLICWVGFEKGVKLQERKELSPAVRFATLSHISTFLILYVIVLFNKLPFQRAITLQNIPTDRFSITLGKLYLSN